MGEGSLGDPKGNRGASSACRLLKGLNQLEYFPCGIIFAIYILSHKIF